MQVVCYQLGFALAVGFTSNSFYGGGVGAVHLDNVQCRGEEGELAACPHPGWGVVNPECDAHGNDAGVVCAGECVYAGVWEGGVREEGVWEGGV